MSKITSLETSNSISDYEDEEQDTISVATSECSRNDQVILAEDGQQDQPNFGNIAVTNSTDIHFGNKTYYQGPVTIKQVLYANSKNSDSDGETAVNSNFASDNPGFVPDQFAAKVKVDGSDKVNVTETRQPKGTRWLQRFSRQHVLLITSLAVVLLMSLITLMVVLMNRHQSANNGLPPQYPKDSDEQDSGIPPDYPVDSVENSTLASEFRIISRKEWLADPPKPGVEVLKIPVPYVIIMHTASEPCSSEEVCKKMVKDVQEFHAEGRGWSDIGYSFLVGGDGNAYEGRGWYNVGAQVYGYNSACIGIAFIGIFGQVLPPLRQLNAARELIRIGLDLKVISPNYKLLTARQLQTTQSPGEALYKLVKTWDHWSPTP
ncbi:peptidoglycan-recognition protein LC-like isoform X2 [Photinus pyralis]|uniref:Peptidoglycan recognition protein family domain-containing protein n=1 Tax=Photinus pyralis TaxID=7054 RepID=A0A1Y1KN21_PHOPY|nr:peptidoglycan-recognition protein LC-like isoform X2 [Photinus pyralis]XP_031358998.1 peptidoglycan-recognition protein LC-like isoform X2 [Photinus pyralis]